jgi:hypothetical protein
VMDKLPRRVFLNRYKHRVLPSYFHAYEIQPTSLL